ncbi:hypothetical protein BsWGS_12529 [Bradybaena similaris]
MKLSSLLFVLLLVVVVLMAVFLGGTEARKKKPNKKACKWDRKGVESPCNTTTNTMEVTLKVRKGDSATCQPKVISKPCNDKSQSKRAKVRGCKYERKGSGWTECDATTNERTKVMKLKAGSNPECEETKTKTKSCGGGSNKKASRKTRKDA